jgi:hypothetical protein
MTVHLAYDAHLARLEDLHRDAAKRRRVRVFPRRSSLLRRLIAGRRPRRVASPSPRSAHEGA